MRGTLLFVDDDRDDIELTLLGFRGEHFEAEVAVAQDGAEALEFLLKAYEAGRPLPAAILTDLKMPRMDGLELIRRLKADARLRDIPVLVLTSSGYQADMDEALRLGASRYLRKPANLDEYAEIVRQLRDAMHIEAPRQRSV
jgi:two-component system response regulator